jgi:hypothetical protein
VDDPVEDVPDPNDDVDPKEEDPKVEVDDPDFPNDPKVDDSADEEWERGENDSEGEEAEEGEGEDAFTVDERGTFGKAMDVPMGREAPEEPNLTPVTENVTAAEDVTGFISDEVAGFGTRHDEHVAS